LPKKEELPEDNIFSIEKKVGLQSEKRKVRRRGGGFQRQKNTNEGTVSSKGMGHLY
jgi:hypothetical protein